MRSPTRVHELEEAMARFEKEIEPIIQENKMVLVIDRIFKLINKMKREDMGKIYEEFPKDNFSDRLLNRAEKTKYLENEILLKMEAMEERLSEKIRASQKIQEESHKEIMNSLDVLNFGINKK